MKNLLWLMLLGVFSVQAKNTVFKAPTVKGSAVEFKDYEYIPTKLKEKRVSMKSAHGKTISRVVPVEALKIKGKNKELLISYLENVASTLLGVLKPVKSKSKTKKKKVKLSGHIKIQIQKTGRFDILSIQTNSVPTNQAFEEQLYSLGKLEDFPVKLELDEMQVKFNIK